MLAANDEMALGAIAAITESGRQDILLTIALRVSNHSRPKFAEEYEVNNP